MTSHVVKSETDLSYCQDCDHVMQKGGPTYTWLCMKAPQPLQGFVTKTWWDDDPPYYRCKDVNRFGNCRWWTEAPEPKEQTK